MDKVKVIEIKKSVFEDNDREADQLRSELKGRGVFLLNLMSSPGSGKTTTLISLINKLKVLRANSFSRIWLRRTAIIATHLYTAMSP